MQTMFSSHLLEEARRYWRMSMVRGIVSIIFGLLAIFWPHLTYSLFFYIFGGFAIVEGLLLIMNGASQRGMGQMGSASYQRGRTYQPYQGSQTSQRGVPPQPGAPYRPGAAPPESTAYQTGMPPQEGARYQPPQEGTRYQTGVPPQEGAAYQAGFPRQEGAGYQAGMPPQGGAGYQSSAGATFGEQAPYRGSAPFQALTSKVGLGSVSQTTVGILSVICGILAFVLPGVIGVLVIYAIAAWAMFRGIGALMESAERGWVMGVIGILAIILSLFLFIDPFGAIRTFLWGIGVFALIMGILQVIRALRQNAASTRPTRPMEPSY